MRTRTERCAGGPAEIEPLLSEGRRVLVDGHPICADCGGAVEPLAPGQWRHGVSRRPRLSLTDSYEQFTARFPWLSVSAQEWRDASGTLSEYQKLKTLAALSRLRQGENPYLDLFRRLMTACPSPLLDLAERRRELASLFSWAIPTDAALELLAKYAPLVECGAGMGYWLALLRARGVDAIGYDVSRPGLSNAFHKRARQHPLTPLATRSSRTRGLLDPERPR